MESVAAEVVHTQLERVDARNIYVSHLLSTWNARSYEFAAILFTASVYPKSLAASSVRGILTTLALICFSGSVGDWVDRSPSRLRTLITTITTNRASVILASLIWLTLVSPNSKGLGTSAFSTPLEDGLHMTQLQDMTLFKNFMFFTVLLVGVVERLSGVANMISMERDWVPTLASPSDASHPHSYDLMHLNSVMRRIDLTCKLVAPIVISFVIVWADSVRIGVIVIMGMSLASWPVEWLCALRVWNRIPQLRGQKSVDQVPESGTSSAHGRRTALAAISAWIAAQDTNLREYFSTPVWIPSFALTILHVSVLVYSATFITYLLSTGEFSLTTITFARAASSVVEVSSTLVMPWGVRFLSRRSRPRVASGFEGEEEALLRNEPALPPTDAAGLERVGLWGLSWQFLCLIPVVLAIWRLPHVMAPPHLRLLRSIYVPTFLPDSVSVSKFFMYFFLCFSRLGLWTYDLAAQQLTQTRVAPNRRSTFAGVETSFVGLFELVQWFAAMAVGGAVDEFRWLALGSLCAVGISSAMYAYWLRRERGHLVHWPPLLMKETGNLVIHTSR